MSLSGTNLSITSGVGGTVNINSNVSVSQPGILRVGTSVSNSYISFNGVKLFVSSTDPSLTAGLVSAGDIWINSA